MTEKKIIKPRPISGFPEYLPEVRRVEQLWLDHIRRIFESYGFCSVETPSVEELDIIAAKGEVDKEIYVIERLHREEGDKEARLALHFDQTVPLARYVAQHFGDLVFPFKRYQMQKVWRGERPQAGRFREFVQCDIDVIGIDALPLHFDAEMPAIIWEVLSSLPGMENEKIQIRISNRKILMGFLDSIKVTYNQNGNRSELKPLTDAIKKTIVSDIDKLHKIGKELVMRRIDDLGVQSGIGFGLNKLVEPYLDLCERKFSSGDDLHEALTNSPNIDTSNETLQEGLKELIFILEQLSHLKNNEIVADLSIVRGLDYYTGTVYETTFNNDPGYGSICSGGRYDDLAGTYINKHLPGVGISIGFSRLFAKLLSEGKLPIGPLSPADILMVLPSEETRAIASETARILRGRGYNVELYHAPQKIKKQMEYASRKKIPYVWFPPFENGQAHEVKDMTAQTQSPADPHTWENPQ